MQAAPNARRMQGTLGSFRTRVGLGGVFLPEAMARPWLEAGHLVQLATERLPPSGTLHCAWRVRAAGQPGLALQWWLRQLAHPSTREALLTRYRGR